MKNEDLDDYTQKDYINFSEEEIYKLIDIIITDDEIYRESKEEILLNLSLFSYGCGEKLPGKFYDYLIQNEMFSEYVMYLRADEDVAKKLIQIIESRTDIKASWILSCIAAIQCETTKLFLQKNSVEPLPEWAKKLYVLPTEYSKLSGWYINKNDKIEKLYNDDIIAFENCEIGDTSKLAPFKYIDEKCEYCGNPLLLVFNGKQKLATCLYCSCYETIFTKQIGDSIKWHEENEDTGIYDDYEASDIKRGLKILNEQRKPTFTASEFLVPSTGLNQIGGMPTSSGSEIHYPICPDCGQVMKFVAQYGSETEGLYYFFSCEDCNVHASNYGQT